MQLLRGLLRVADRDDLAASRIDPMMNGSCANHTGSPHTHRIPINGDPAMDG